MNESRNYGTPTTRRLVTGRIQKVVEWCAVDPDFPIASSAQVWWDDETIASEIALKLGTSLAKRVQQTTTSYITEEVSQRAE